MKKAFILSTEKKTESGNHTRQQKNKFLLGFKKQ